MNIADKTIFNILAKSSEALMLLVSSVVFARYLSRFDYGTFLQVMLVVNTDLYGAAAEHLLLFPSG